MWYNLVLKRGYFDYYLLWLNSVRDMFIKVYTYLRCNSVTSGWYVFINLLVPCV
jgi:hypothetical protein